MAMSEFRHFYFSIFKKAIIGMCTKQLKTNDRLDSKKTLYSLKGISLAIRIKVVSII